jgi:hypothetical protein
MNYEGLKNKLEQVIFEIDSEHDAKYLEISPDDKVIYMINDILGQLIFENDGENWEKGRVDA